MSSPEVKTDCASCLDTRAHLSRLDREFARVVRELEHREAQVKELQARGTELVEEIRRLKSGKEDEWFRLSPGAARGGDLQGSIGMPVIMVQSESHSAREEALEERLRMALDRATEAESEVIRLRSSMLVPYTR